MKSKIAFIISFLLVSITLVGQTKVFNNDTIYSCNGLSTEIYYSLNHDSILWSNGNNNDTTIYGILGAASCTVYLNGNSQLISFFIKPANNTAFPVIGYFNTANNGSGGKLSSGFDLHWQLSRVSISGPYNPATVVSNPTSAWYSSPWPNANWISGNSQGNHEIQTDTTYFFRNSFSLPCTDKCGQSILDSGNYCLNLEFFADNYISEIYVNGKPQFSKYNLLSLNNPYSQLGFVNGNQRSLNLCDDFQPGQNELIVILKSSPFAYGFLCQTNQNILNNNSNNIDTIYSAFCDSTVIDNRIYRSDTTIRTFALNSNNQCAEIFNILKINKTKSDTTYYNQCSPLIVYGDTLIQSGIYKYKFNGLKCDSLQYIDLTINPTYKDTLYFSNCDSLTTNYGVFKSDTIFTQTYSSTNYCDSIISFNISIKNDFIDTVEFQSCRDTTISNFLFQFNQTTTFNYTRTNGCDSAITYIYRRLPTDTLKVNITGCDSVQVGLTQKIYFSCTLYNNLTNKSGCDSIIEINININNSDSIYYSFGSCHDTTLNGIFFNASGLYKTTYNNSKNCDSSVFYNFTKYNTYFDTLMATSCDSVILNGIKFFQSDTLQISNKSKYNCDSNTVLISTIINSQITESELYFCNKGSLNNIIYTTNDSIENHFINVLGCDSIHKIFINVIIPQKNTISDSIIICRRDISKFSVSDSLNLTNDYELKYFILNPDIYNRSLELKFIDSNQFCPDTIAYFLFADECDYKIWLPNAFTPNNDLINQNFTISSQNIVEFFIVIYNRFGQEVFRSNDVNFKFTPNQAHLSEEMQDVFTYRIQFRYQRGINFISPIIERYGTITAYQ